MWLCMIEQRACSEHILSSETSWAFVTKIRSEAKAYQLSDAIMRQACLLISLARGILGRLHCTRQAAPSGLARSTSTLSMCSPRPADSCSPRRGPLTTIYTLQYAKDAQADRQASARKKKPQNRETARTVNDLFPDLKSCPCVPAAHRQILSPQLDAPCGFGAGCFVSRR